MIFNECFLSSTAKVDFGRMGLNGFAGSWRRFQQSFWFSGRPHALRTTPQYAKNRVSIKRNKHRLRFTDVSRKTSFEFTPRRFCTPSIMVLSRTISRVAGYSSVARSISVAQGCGSGERHRDVQPGQLKCEKAFLLTAIDYLATMIVYARPMTKAVESQAATKKAR